jgi:hypothetical protein
MKKLSSKRYSAGNRDYWWYNLSSPEDWIDSDHFITLILNGKDDTDYIGSIILPLDKSDWHNHIVKASNHIHNNRNIIKVHVFKENGSEHYRIYFGKVSDGVYPVKLKQE